MGPQAYMWFVIDRNTVMQSLTVVQNKKFSKNMLA